MNINSSIGQYNGMTNNIQNTSSQSLTGDTVSSLKEGQVFEGSINSVDEKGRVTIGLANGQTLSARLDSGVSILQGQSLFFQVKSNDGSLVQIRPVSLDINSNPTLLKALDNANIMATAKTVSMVNSMMLESMPIDSEHLASMNRIILNNPDIKPETLVLMSKFDLPVSKENAAMFEIYSQDAKAVASDVNVLGDNISNLIAGKTFPVSEAININSQINSIISELTDSINNDLESNNTGVQISSDISTSLNETIEETKLNLTNNVLDDNSKGIAENVVKAEIDSNNTADNKIQTALNTFENINLTSENKLLLEAGVKKDFEGLLSKLPEFTESNKALFSDEGRLLESTEPSKIFKAIANYLEESKNVDPVTIKNLFSSEGYKSILKNILAESYSLKPEELAKEKSISKSYEKLSRLTHSLEEVFVNNTSKEADSIKQSLTSIRNNINFMNSANDIYSFVQIPLKMFQQNTEGSLYVRQNKRSAYENGEEITCFLHFDMKYLGPTDIYVKLKQQNVNCDWHLADEASMALIEANLDILEQRLASKGFNLNYTTSCDEKKMDFVNDFLRAGVSSATDGLVHRYSFDMKA